MPSARTVSRVRMPWRSRSSSATVRRCARGSASERKIDDVSDQRPCMRRLRRPAPRAEPAGPAAAALEGRALRAGQRQARGAQRRPRVVGDLAGPDEVPERLLEVLRREVDLGQQVGEEARRAAEPLAQQVVRGLARRVDGAAGRSDRLGVLAEVQGDLPGAAPERPGADPDHLAGRAQLVEPRRRVGAGAAREDVALPHVGRQRQPLQRDEHLAQAIAPGARRGVAVDALPRWRERRQRPLVGGLDLLAQRRERRAAQPAQDVGIAPLALAAAPRPQLAADQVARDLERTPAPRSCRRGSGRAAPRW